MKKVRKIRANGYSERGSVKYIPLLILVMLSLGCSSFSPTGYIVKEDCGMGGQLTFKAECFGGYSSTTISENKLLVTFEGNEYTSLQRATDLAILHCSELALNSRFAFVSIDIAERKLMTSVSSSEGKTSTSNYPIASIYCSTSSTKANGYIEARTLNADLKSKYEIH